MKSMVCKTPVVQLAHHGENRVLLQRNQKNVHKTHLNGLLFALFLC
jgi:hypothetical protein